ncbi:MAG: porin [bacterium]|nr:porin [bacterium]
MFAQATTQSSGSFDFNTEGIVFATADTTSRIIMRFRMQNWATVNMNESFKIISSDLVVRRLRLRLGGHVFDPRLTFNLQLNFGRADLDATDQPVPNLIRDAMVYWNFSQTLQVGFGQTKLPGNRQRVISSGDQFFPDRSILNGAYNLDRDFGLQGFWRPIASDVIVNLRASVSSGDGRNQGTIVGDGFAYTGRLEVLPFGAFKDGGDYTEGDLARESSPKVSIGGSFQYNDKTTRTRGELGPVLFQQRTTQIIYTDALLKWSGFSFYGEWAQRSAEDPITRDTKDTTKTSAVFVGSGFLAQAMYVLPSNWGFGLRYATTDAHEDLIGRSEFKKDENMAVCLAYFINKHRIKSQLESGLNRATLYNLANKEEKTFYARLNLEFGI